MVPTIESDETELIFKVITKAEPDSRIILSYIYIHNCVAISTNSTYTTEPLLSLSRYDGII